MSDANEILDLVYRYPECLWRKNKNNYTALHIAAQSSQQWPDSLCIIVDCITGTGQHELFTQCSNDGTALHVAIKAENTHTIKLLHSWTRVSRSGLRHDARR